VGPVSDGRPFSWRRSSASSSGRTVLGYKKGFILPNCKKLYFTTDAQYIANYISCVVDDAKCIVVTRVGLPVCHLSAATCHCHCTDRDVTWGSGR